MFDICGLKCVTSTKFIEDVIYRSQTNTALMGECMLDGIMRR